MLGPGRRPVGPNHIGSGRLRCLICKVGVIMWPQVKSSVTVIWTVIVNFIGLIFSAQGKLFYQIRKKDEVYSPRVLGGMTRTSYHSAKGFFEVLV